MADTKELQVLTFNVYFDPDEVTDSLDAIVHQLTHGNRDMVRFIKKWKQIRTPGERTAPATGGVRKLTCPPTGAIRKPKRDRARTGDIATPAKKHCSSEDSEDTEETSANKTFCVRAICRNVWSGKNTPYEGEEWHSDKERRKHRKALAQDALRAYGTIAAASEYLKKHDQKWMDYKVTTAVLEEAARKATEERIANIDMDKCLSPVDPDYA